MIRRCLSLALALALLVAVGALPLQSAAPPPPPIGPGSDPAAVALDKGLMEEIQKNSELMKNLRHLSDSIGPRLTGSANLEKANHWTAEVMRGYGLTNVRLEAWTIPEGWERGPATARLLSEPHVNKPIPVASSAWSPGTKGKVEGEVVYLKAESIKDLEKYKGKLKNAIVLMRPPSQVPKLEQIIGKSAAERDRTKGGPGGPGGPGLRQRGDFGKRNFSELAAFRRELSAFLAKEGAAAMLSDSGKPLGLLMTGGGWGGRGGAPGEKEGDRASATNRLPSINVAHNHYDLLYRLATNPNGPRPRMELEVSNKFIPGPVKVFNTVGELKGSEKPDEYVVVGAHLDSWDLGTGTTDNGTGTSVVLETARVLAKSPIKPKRTIVFALFSGEEQGLHGSREFVRQHKDLLAKTSVALVHDTGTGRVRGIGTGGGRAGYVGVMERELASLKELGVSEFTGAVGGGSDHQSFASATVPGFMLTQDMSYYSYTHHTQADTFDAAIEPNLIQGAQVMAVTAMRIANLNTLLPRTAGRQMGMGMGGRGGRGKE
ncbi:MAG: M20/M25/M40 family metallo-hydrolase [Gemmataceae bacterium]